MGFELFHLRAYIQLMPSAIEVEAKLELRAREKIINIIGSLTSDERQSTKAHVAFQPSNISIRAISTGEVRSCLFNTYLTLQICQIESALSL